MEEYIKPDYSDTYEINESTTATTYSEKIEGVDLSYGKGYYEDLFGDIPEEIRLRPRIKEFCEVFSKTLASYDCEIQSLSRFTLSEHDDDSVTMEWLYNYFRAIVSFDKDKDMYGFILSNTIDHVYKTEYKPLNQNCYVEASRELIDKVLQNL